MKDDDFIHCLAWMMKAWITSDLSALVKTP